MTINRNESRQAKDAPLFLVRITKVVVCIAFVLCFIFFDKFSFKIGSIDRIECFLIGIAIALVAVIVYFVITKRYDGLWFQILALTSWVMIAVFLLAINSIYSQRYNELVNKETPNSGVTSVQLSLQAEYFSTSGVGSVNKKSIRDPGVRINDQTIENGCGTVEVELGKEYTAEFFVGLLSYNSSATKEITFTKEMLEEPTSFKVDVYFGDGYSAIITVKVKKSISLTPFELVFGEIR